MIHRLLPLALACILPTPAHAAGQIPEPVTSLTGCWSGIGVLSNRPVKVRLTVTPTIPDAVIVADLVTTGEANPLDHYQAHILLGGDVTSPTRIVGTWADSFGMAFAAMGDGSTLTAGFDLTWFYPADNVLSRWRRFGDQLALSLVRMPREPARPGTPEEKPFADYALSRVACPGAAPLAPPPPLKPGRQRTRTG